MAPMDLVPGPWGLYSVSIVGGSLAIALDNEMSPPPPGAPIRKPLEAHLI